MATPPRAQGVLRCRRCGSETLLHDRVAGFRNAIEVFACEDCGDYWFESAGATVSLDGIGDAG